MPDFEADPIGRLAKRLTDTPIYLRRRQGNVNSVNTNGTLDITLGGSSVVLPGVACLRGFVPVVGQSIWVDINGADLLVIGTTTVSAWTAYTPTWQGTAGTGGTVGNGTLVGAYSLEGKTLHWRVTLNCGSTTTYGTGIWSFTIPLSLKFAGTTNDRVVVSAWAFDSSANLEYVGVARGNGGQGANVDQNGTLIAFPNALAKSTIPFTWATGDILAISGSAEVA